MGRLSPTRQEIHDAHEALDALISYTKSYGAVTGISETETQEITQKLHQDIATFLPPIPEPTMNEIEWDDDKHHLAEAEDEHGIRMIMVSDELDFIRCMQPPNAGGIVLGVPKKDLTPTGRRYVLQDKE